MVGLTMLGACKSLAQRGAIGLQWGDDVAAAARELGGSCQTTRAGEFDDCHAGPIVAFGRRPQVTLVGEHGELVGVRLSFDAECDRSKLQELIGDQFDVVYTPGDNASPYSVLADGELVYFADCELVVGNPRYGKYFTNELLGHLGDVLERMIYEVQPR